MQKVKLEPPTRSERSKYGAYTPRSDWFSTTNNLGLVSFSLTLPPSRGKVKLFGGLRSCREIICSEICSAHAAEPKREEQVYTRNGFKTVLVKNSNFSRERNISEINSVNFALMWRSYRSAKNATFKRLVKEARDGATKALRVMNMLEDAAGWRRSRAYVMDMSNLDAQGAGLSEPTHLGILFHGPRRWCKGPYFLSLYTLIARGITATGKQLRNKDFASFEDLSLRFKQVKGGRNDPGFIRSTIWAWLPMVLNQDKLYPKRTYKSAVSDLPRIGTVLTEGISRACTNNAADPKFHGNFRKHILPEKSAFTKRVKEKEERCA